MTFQEVLAQVIAWLQRERRVSYRALKRQFGLDDDYLEDLKDDHDDTRTIRARLTGQVLTLDEALPEDSPFLALDPPQRRQCTLNALKRFLLRESQVQPLRLVFEDLHWIDSETQALLDSLVESLPITRILLLVNYRPEYQHGWGSKTYYTQLRLDLLPPARAGEVLQASSGAGHINDSGTGHGAGHAGGAHRPAAARGQAPPSDLRRYWL
jgi:hypothetical protein